MDLQFLALDKYLGIEDAIKDKKIFYLASIKRNDNLPSYFDVEKYKPRNGMILPSLSEYLFAKVSSDNDNAVGRLRLISIHDECTDDFVKVATAMKTTQTFIIHSFLERAFPGEESKLIIETLSECILDIYNGTELIYESVACPRCHTATYARKPEPRGDDGCRFYTCRHCKKETPYPLLLKRNNVSAKAANLLFST